MCLLWGKVVLYVTKYLGEGAQVACLVRGSVRRLFPYLCCMSPLCLPPFHSVLYCLIKKEKKFVSEFRNETLYYKSLYHETNEEVLIMM